MSRIDLLQGFLAENPHDSFSRYALALEYAKIHRDEDAVREFETIRRNDPKYVATYYQLAKVYARLGRIDDAGATCREGMTVAAAAGDAHAHAELAAALESL